MAKTPQKSSGLRNFFSGLFSGMMGGSLAEREKKRRLKDIRRELRKRSRYFRLKGDLAAPGLARWFYEIYKIVGPADVLLDKYSKSGVLRTVLVESFLPGDIQAVAANLNPDRIRERAVKAKNIKVFVNQIKSELNSVISSMNTGTARRINKLYNDLYQLQAFVHFQYYFLLKKFDSSFPERNYSYNPRFEAISGQSVKNDLMEFLDVYYALDNDAEWDILFDILKNYRDMDIVSRSGWKKVLSGRREMVKTRTLDLIIRYLEENPRWVSAPEKSNYEIVEEYFIRIKNQTEQTVHQILNERRKRYNDKLLEKLFGTTSISRTQHYTERDNVTFKKKKLEGYKYVDPMNYLKAFFLDFYKGKIRVLVDLLLIQGKWTTKAFSQHFSETYHNILPLSDRLMTFDSSLAHDGYTGGKIKRLLMQSARDKSALNSLRNTLHDVNEEAKKIINQSAQSFIVLGKIIKKLSDEYAAGTEELIINWKEVGSRSEEPLGDQMTDIYNCIYYLIQILQLHMKDNK